MRRKLFYICVALLAFLVGLAVVARYSNIQSKAGVSAPYPTQNGRQIKPGERITIIDRDGNVTHIEGR
jgi:hypothetical protein